MASNRWGPPRLFLTHVVRSRAWAAGFCRLASTGTVETPERTPAIDPARVLPPPERGGRGGKIGRQLKPHPIGLLQRARVGYIACTINEYEDVRLLALHRISSATLLDEPHRPHTSEMIDQAKSLVEAGFADRGKIKLVIRMKAFSAQHLEESPLSKDQKMVADAKDGHFRISATVNDTDQLRWWLLGYGDGVEVIEPPELRHWATTTHADASAL